LVAAAEQWLAEVTRPVQVHLSGELGAGKSTFVRAALAALGYKGNVKSPTFSLLETYHFNDMLIHHMDLYRLNHPEELEYLGFRDYVNCSDRGHLVVYILRGCASSCDHCVSFQIR